MDEIIYSAIDAQARVIDMKLIALLDKPGFYATTQKAFEMAAAGDYDDDEYEAAVSFNTGDEALDAMLYRYADYAAYVRQVVGRGEADEKWMIDNLVYVSELSGMVQAMAEEFAKRKDRAQDGLAKRWKNAPVRAFVMPIAKELHDAWAAEPGLYPTEMAMYDALRDKAYPHTVSYTTFRKWRDEWKATK